MSWIYRFSMKMKLVMALLPVLLALLWLALSGMLTRIDTEQQMRSMAQLTQLASRAGAMAHELQKERGMSVGYLSSQGQQFATELDAQRQRTDSALTAFTTAAQRSDPALLQGGVARALNDFQRRSADLTRTRQQISSQTLPQPQALAFYSGSVNTVLELVGSLSHLAHSGAIANQLVAYYSLLSLKDQAGIERALLSGIFSADRFGDGQYRRLSEVVGREEALINATRQLSPPAVVTAFDQALSQPDASQAQKLRDLAFSKAESGNFGVRATDWFSAQSKRIDVLKQLEDTSAATLLATSQQLAQTARADWQRFLAIALAALVIALAFAVLVARSIHQQLHQTLTTIQQMDGDLTQRLAVPGSDELSALNRAYNQSIENIQDIVSQIKGGAVVLRDTSASIAAGNQDLAQRTDEQAASLVETAASMEQIATVITQTADNAKEAERLTQSMEAEMLRSSQVAGAASQSMSAIRSSSEQIAQIIGSIDDISFQTNLLALNAAVEAARAGELGRGFAVVASEVRNLSQRCAREASQIRALVTQNMEKIVLGVEQVQASGEALQAAVAQSASMRQFISEIAQAAGEQSLGVSQVHLALSQLEQVTQQNAALVSDAATASQTLDLQSEAMSTLVNRFTVA